MIEVTQTRLGGQRGNCYAACVASIFHLDIAKLPHVPDTDEEVLAKYPLRNEYATVGDSISSWWWDMWAEWFAANNLTTVRFSADNVGFYEAQKIHAFHIMTGNSPRDKEQKEARGTGRLHAVVGKRGLVYFDPYPSKEGLASIREYELIVPADPTKPILEAYRAGGVVNG